MFRSHGLRLGTGAVNVPIYLAALREKMLRMAGALGGGWWLTALGGLSFVASDFLIGVTDIRETHIENANDWIWLTYLAGQMGIVYAAAT